MKGLMSVVAQFLPPRIHYAGGLPDDPDDPGTLPECLACPYPLPRLFPTLRLFSYLDIEFYNRCSFNLLSVWQKYNFRMGREISRGDNIIKTIFHRSTGTDRKSTR